MDKVWKSARQKVNVIVIDGKMENVKPKQSSAAHPNQ